MPVGEEETLTAAGPRGRNIPGQTPGTDHTRTGRGLRAGLREATATAELEVKSRRIARLRKQLTALAEVPSPEAADQVARIQDELDRLSRRTAPGPRRLTGQSSPSERTGNRFRTTWRPAEGVSTTSRSALLAGVNRGDRASDVEITAPISRLTTAPIERATPASAKTSARDPFTDTAERGRPKFASATKRPGSIPVSELLRANDSTPEPEQEWPDEYVIPTRRRINVRRAAVVSVVLVVLAGIGVFALTPLILRIGHGGGVEQVSHQGQTASAQAEVKRVDFARPFARTPAANLPDGIKAPPAVAVGDIPAAEVERAFTRVREAITAARVNEAVLRGDREPYLSLLAPNARARVQEILAGPASPQTANYVSSLAPGVKLLGTRATRASGDMTPRLDQNGALVIRADYVVAYAFDPGDRPISNPLDMVVLERWQADYVVLDDRWAPEDQGLWPGAAKAFGYSISCPAYAAGQLAPVFTNKEAKGGLPPADNYFNLAQPLPVADGCTDAASAPVATADATANAPTTSARLSQVPPAGGGEGPTTPEDAGSRAPRTPKLPSVDNLVKPPPPSRR